MTKMGEKPYPLRLHILILPYKGVRAPTPSVIRCQYSHKLSTETIVLILELIHHPDSVEYPSYWDSKSSIIFHKASDPLIGCLSALDSI